MQSKKSLEKFYSKDDPWGYETNNDDKIRKEIILRSLHELDCRFEKALDIGAGQGFVTRDLPAEEIYAYEISEKACNRLPKGIKVVKEIDGKFDLIIATGVLYKQYDYEGILKIIRKHSSKYVLTCNIQPWEKNDLDESRIVYQEIFPYREYLERLVIYNFSK